MPDEYQTFSGSLVLDLRIWWRHMHTLFIFFDRHVDSSMSRTAIALKFKMCLFLDEACSWAEKLITDISLPPLMPEKDNYFSDSFVLDFRKWWRHMQSKNRAFRDDHVTSAVVEKRKKLGTRPRWVSFLVKTYKSLSLHVSKYFYEDTLFATLWLLRHWSSDWTSDDFKTVCHWKHIFCVKL